ncbi:DUF7344 domain-containing protein [Natrinema halophilum]|uniref:DUF7344 domain-containing protein n=1 Tax=Natrinema halophilum TaxID=1699371 RepID=A0A7D5GP62_9EURY|nr:hypothetical protein [Natrinema halophilum]QLG50073.1 hypothetical protein HYG82_15015 [Natrinema halophilum]
MVSAIETSENEGDELTKDTLFHLLESRRRRWTIRYLKQRGGRADIGDLAEQIAAWENETSTDRVSSQQRKRAYTALQQRHVPRLDKAGVVDFDRNRGTVEVTDRMQELDVYLEVVPKRDIPWSTYYLGLGIVSCTWVGLMAVVQSPFESAPDLGWAALIGFLFTASAAVHTYRSNKLPNDPHDTLPESEL